MNTCDSCRWWDIEVRKEWHRDNPAVVEYGQCNNPKVNGEDPLQDNQLNMPSDQARPEASDDYGICFHTGPKFGCLHHEPKV